MEGDDKWYFTREQLANTPSRRMGFDSDKELSSRQQAANFIQDMGQRLQVTQLCINTAIVYMHRFYMYHSFTRFHRNAIASAALFLAAKVEEQPRKLEHVIKVSQICLHREQPPLDVKSELYQEQAQELVMNENILLQTLGFDVAIDHPHTHVVRCCTLVRASKDLAQTSYFMASNSLHLTTMCLQYKPTVVACFCIHLASKWSNWEIPHSTEGKQWFWYVDKSVTQELLEQLTEEFLAIFEKCPSRLKKKIVSISSSQHSNMLTAFNAEKEKQRNGESSAASGHQNTGMPYPNPNPVGPSSSSSVSNNVTNEEKRKLEYSQRHHSEYNKRPHISSHHSRVEIQNVPVKSSCMFGPPQRTQPPPPLNANIPPNVPTSGSNNSNNVNSMSGQRLPINLKPIVPPEQQQQKPRRPDGTHYTQQPSYKKEQHSNYYPQQPPTVEVPKPTVVPPPPVVKVERSIFSPEVPTTPELKIEPVIRIKEEKIEEPSPPIIPFIPKEEKIEIKQEVVEVKQEPILETPVEEQHREVKKKKKKHKEHKEHRGEKHKDKHKHKKDKYKEPAPIVITIPKERLALPETPLKIKISKDKIASISSPVKLKIPKEKLKESRKRDRSDSHSPPGSTGPSKRPNGAVQVTSIELQESITGNECLGPHTPPEISKSPEIDFFSSVPNRVSPPVTPPPPPVAAVPPPPPNTSRPNVPRPYSNPRHSFNNTAPAAHNKFRPGQNPRHMHRPPGFGRGRGRGRYPRPAYYQPRFPSHPPQAIYQQPPPPIGHFPYYFPVQQATFQTPQVLPLPPLPDEPPPQPPPPPPES